MFHKLCVSILAIFSTFIAIADTEFEDSVPLDLVQALLGSPAYGSPMLYSDLSSAFPEIDFPDSLEIMGSLERGYGGITAVFGTAFSDSETQSALDEVFLKADYTEFELVRRRIPQGGFVAANAIIPQMSNRYCHDSQGFVSHSYLEKAPVNIVTVSATPSSDRRSCADQLAEQQQQMSSRIGRSGIQQYLPRMELPETTNRRFAPVGFGGYSGSSSAISTQANLDTDWEIEEVFKHFSDQISDQNWSVDSQNVGNASAAGTWTLNPEPGSDFIGTLTVLKVGDGSFQLKFQLTATGASSNSNSSYGVFQAN